MLLGRVVLLKPPILSYLILSIFFRTNNARRELRHIQLSLFTMTLDWDRRVPKGSIRASIFTVWAINKMTAICLGWYATMHWNKRWFVSFLLQTGIYIIDSPGFGENATMDKLLLDYISNNQIFAFIYVIKSDNAGGVQEDRVSSFPYYHSFHTFTTHSLTHFKLFPLFPV